MEVHSRLGGDKQRNRGTARPIHRERRRRERATWERERERERERPLLPPPEPTDPGPIIPETRQIWIQPAKTRLNQKEQDPTRENRTQPDRTRPNQLEPLSVFMSVQNQSRNGCERGEPEPPSSPTCPSSTGGFLIFSYPSIDADVCASHSCVCMNVRHYV